MYFVLDLLVIKYKKYLEFLNIWNYVWQQIQNNYTFEVHSMILL